MRLTLIPSQKDVKEPRSPDSGLALRWAAIAVLILGWELISRLVVSDESYLAPPSRVIGSGPAYLLETDTLVGLWTTTLRFLAAFGITAAFGVQYTLPLMPFYPLFVLWFRLGFPSEVAFAHSTASFPSSWARWPPPSG